MFRVWFRPRSPVHNSIRQNCIQDRFLKRSEPTRQHLWKANVNTGNAAIRTSRRDYSANGGPGREERPRPQGPRPPIDVTGPRLPRMVQSVTAARCYNCSTTLPSDVDFQG